MGLLGSVALPGPAQAHTDLAASVPAPGDSLGAPPALVRLKFNEVVAKEFANLTLTVGKQKPAQLRSEVSGNTVTAEVPADLRTTAEQTTQRWRVAYRVVSEDGHPVTGTLTFNVEATASPRPSPSTSPTQATPEAESGAESGSDPAHDDESNVKVSDEQVSGPGASAWLPTAIIGLITTSVSAVLIVWVARGRREDKRG